MICSKCGKRMNMTWEEDLGKSYICECGNQEDVEFKTKTTSSGYIKWLYQTS